MFGKLLKFELKYHTHQVGFWISVLAVALFAFLAQSVDFITVGAEGGERIKTNGAVPVAMLVTALGMLSIFFAAVFVVHGVMRDEDHKFLEIVHGTPVKTRDLILSRMSGVWIITSLVIFAGVIGAACGQLAPWADKETFAPFNPLVYLYPSVIFILINALFVSGFYTIVAALTRDKVMVYVSAVALFALYLGVSVFVGEDGTDAATSLLDPFGSGALAIVTEFWPPDEQNNRLMPIMGWIGANRLLWGVIGLLMFVTSYRFFKRGLVTRKTKKSKDLYTAPTERIALKPADPELGFANTMNAFLTRFKYEYFRTVKSVPFIILIGVALVLFAVNIYARTTFIPDPVLPTSTDMAIMVIGSFGLSMLIIVVFFGGDLIWRDRVAKINEILDATPVKSGVLMASKWATLIAIVYTLVLVSMLFGMIAQLIIGKGAIPVNPWVYLKIGGVGIGLGFVFMAIMAMFVQNFAPNRVLGMLLAAGVLVGLEFFGQLPFYHPLMEYGSTRLGQMSEMAGYQTLVRFKWFFPYWACFALIMAVLSIWLWRRGLQTNLKTRLTSIASRTTPLTSGLAALGVIGFVFAGFNIYKGYSLDNEYRNSKAQEKYQAAYEKLAKPLLDKNPPKVRAVEANVQFMPAKQEAVAKGKFIVENTTGQPLKTIYVNPPSDKPGDVRHLDIKGAAWMKTGDEVTEKLLSDYDVRRYEFTPPLPPGATTEVTFETFFRAPELGNGSDINRNGTFVNNRDLFPILGIQEFFLGDPDKRRKYDLPEREKRPDRDDAEARQRHFIDAGSDYVDFKATVCTDKGQIPIAPGALMKTYEDNGRACRDYEANRPILNFFSFLSADYTVAEDVWKNPNGDDIPLRIFYHETHDFNVPLMLDAMKSSLDTFTTVFGPYQYEQLRIMEFPYASFAQSFAGTVPFSENIGFVRDPGDPEDIEAVDLATYVTMHEIGHQWFAHQIVPADTKGFNVLSEGLTENSAMTAYEAKLGWQKARRLLEQRAIQSYLTGRTADKDDEPPLALAEGQQYLDYNKASWVFWGLKQYMGEDNMQGAIRAFLDEYGTKGPPYPTTQNLVDYLREAAGPDYQQLITDYWDRITLWELKFGEADVTVTPNSDGSYKVTVPLVVDKKIASEETGKETPVTEMDGESLDEWVEIGFYTEDPKDTLGDEWMALERIKVTQKDSTVSFDVKDRPAYILLDPRRLLIERNYKDNVKELEKNGDAGKS